MSEYLACEGCTLKFTNPAHTGTLTILPIDGGSIGSAAFCGGNEVYTAITFTVTGGSNGSGITAGIGSGTIVGSTTVTYSKTVAVVRKGDKVTITITGLSGGSPASYQSEIAVDDAGQSKVKSE